MNHAVAIRTQHSKIGSNIVGHRNALFEGTVRLEMMRFNKALADAAIALRKTEFTGLASRAMEFLGLFCRRPATLDFTVVCVFAGFDDGC